MKKLFLLIPCLLCIFLAGCAAPIVYDSATGTYYRPTLAYDADSGQYVMENVPVDDSDVVDAGDVDDPIYYDDDGVAYYFVGGQYFYYHGHHRYYVSHLPHGGHYSHGRGSSYAHGYGHTYSHHQYSSAYVGHASYTGRGLRQNRVYLQGRQSGTRRLIVTQQQRVNSKQASSGKGKKN